MMTRATATVAWQRAGGIREALSQEVPAVAEGGAGGPPAPDRRGPERVWAVYSGGATVSPFRLRRALDMMCD